jgi:hypothetical protein
MKILIGITQNPKEADEKICQKLEISGGQTIVGPFMTAKDASEWMKFMVARAEGYEQIALPCNSSADATWYGITVEQIKTQTH